MRRSGVLRCGPFGSILVPYKLQLTRVSVGSLRRVMILSNTLCWGISLGAPYLFVREVWPAQNQKQMRTQWAHHDELACVLARQTHELPDKLNYPMSGAPVHEHPFNRSLWWMATGHFRCPHRAWLTFILSPDADLIGRSCKSLMSYADEVSRDGSRASTQTSSS